MEAHLKRTIALLFVVSILFAPNAFPFGQNKIVYKNFDWHVYTSPHFEVHFYPEEEEFLQMVVSDAESAYLKLSKFLDHEIRFKIPLIYYRTHGDFEQTNVDLAAIPQGVGAFAEPFQNRIVIPIDQPPDRFSAVLRHRSATRSSIASIFEPGKSGAVLESILASRASLRPSVVMARALSSRGSTFCDRNRS